MNAFLEIFPKLSQIFPKAVENIIWFGMSVVCIYHAFISNVFFNAAFEDAKKIERVANVFFIPIHYLCEGKKIYYDEAAKTYQMKQRFNYDAHKKLYVPFALVASTPSFMIGSLIKSIAFLSSETRERYQTLRAQINSTITQSNNAYYRSLGIQVEDFRKASMIDPPTYQRRPGDENHLADDKAGLKAIAKLLSEKEIPFWVECGTCLGAYRYGGVIPWDNDLDLAVIVDDFENVKHALNGLDKNQFIVQDWSSRARPGTYIRVYVVASHNHIDIYHNQIDPKNHTLTNILSNGESNFMTESWKIRERMFTKPVPFDVIFPLKKARFDGIEVPVPNKTRVYLTYKYGPNISPARVYNKETNEYEKDLSHPYWMIPLVQ